MTIASVEASAQLALRGENTCEFNFKLICLTSAFPLRLCASAVKM